MDSEEISWCIAADRIMPLPDPWLQFGLLCSVLANCHRDPKTRPYKPTDFMPVRKRRKTTEEVRAGMNALAARLKGKEASYQS